MNIIFLTQNNCPIENLKNNFYFKPLKYCLYVTINSESNKMIKESKLTICGFKWSLFGKYFKVIKLCSYYIKRKKFDLINISEPLSGLFIGYYLKIKYKIPISVDVRMPIFENFYGESIKVLLFSPLIKLILKKADSIRAMCSKHKEMLEHKLKVSNDKIFVIPPCRLLADFKQNDLDHNIDNHKFQLLCVARLVKQKDIPTLIKSISLVKKTYPDIKCVIVGDGPEKRKISHLVKKMSLEKNILFENKMAHKKLMVYFSRCNVFILSSVRESLGVVMLEAAAAKKPIVATNTIGAQELIKDGFNGYIVPIKDHNKLAERIIFLLSNPHKQKKMGENNLKYIKQKGFYDFDDCLPYVKKMWLYTKSKKFIK